MREPESLPVGFPSTLWTMVRDAGRRRESLEQLVARYWKPVYWYVRLTCGQDAPTAMDLTQDFFIHLLESGFAGKADEAKGRFRALIRVSLRNFVADRKRAERVERRGGGTVRLPMDGADLDSAEALAAGRELGPEQVFDREWATTVFHRAVEETRRRCAAQERDFWFEVFRLHDLEGAGRAGYRDLAARLGRSEDDVDNGLRGARAIFRDCVRAEVRETVGSSADLKEELVELFAWMK